MSMSPNISFFVCSLLLLLTTNYCGRAQVAVDSAIPVQVTQFVNEAH